MRYWITTTASGKEPLSAKSQHLCSRIVFIHLTSNDNVPLARARGFHTHTAHACDTPTVVVLSHSRRIVKESVQGAAERLVRELEVRYLYGRASVLGPQRVALLIAENGHGQHGHAVVDGLDGAVHAAVRDEQPAVWMTWTRKQTTSPVSGRDSGQWPTVQH